MDSYLPLSYLNITEQTNKSTPQNESLHSQSFCFNQHKSHNKTITYSSQQLMQEQKKLVKLVVFLHPWTIKKLFKSSSTTNNKYENDEIMGVLKKCLVMLLKLKYGNESIRIDSLNSLIENVYYISNVDELWDSLLRKLSKRRIQDENNLNTVDDADDNDDDNDYDIWADIDNGVLELGFLEIFIASCFQSFIIVDYLEANKIIKPLEVQIDDLNNKLDGLLIDLKHGKEIINTGAQESTNNGICDYILIDDFTEFDITLLDQNSDVSISRILLNRLQKDEDDLLISSHLKLSVEEHKINKLLSKLSIDSLNMIKITNLPNWKLFRDYGNLYFDNNLKFKVFKHCTSEPIDVENQSKMILFHGPPGSGKSSISKIVGNLIYSFRSNKNDYSIGLLIEFSCAQILSKYINQSDKNLDKLFTELQLILKENPNSYLILLIDEIETLVRSRSYLTSSSSSNSNLQIVNTMLVCLDRLKTFNNLIIFTTSNLLNNIDEAFLDRCDLIYKIDQPKTKSVYLILLNSINQLINDGIINKSTNKLYESFEWCEKQQRQPQEQQISSNNNSSKNSCILLYKLSLICEKFQISGRSLKKMIFSCLVEHCNYDKDVKSSVPLNEYVNGLLNSVLDRKVSWDKVDKLG